MKPVELDGISGYKHTHLFTLFILEQIYPAFQVAQVQAQVEIPSLSDVYQASKQANKQASNQPTRQFNVTSEKTRGNCWAAERLSRFLYL